MKRIILALIVVGVMASPALAKHHKKKKPTPKPSPTARILNPVDAPDGG